MDKESLPNGWDFKRLGDVAKYVNGAAFKPSDWSTKGIPIIRIQNLSNPSCKYNYFEGYLDSKYKVNNGDLLISWSATLDVFIWDRGPAWLNQHIFRVEENPRIIDRRYLAYVVKWVLAKLKAKTHGLTMKHIRRRPFEDTLIPVPPLPEQRRIVSRIEQLTSRLEKTKALQRKAVEETETLCNSAIENMVLSAYEEFEKKSISQVVIDAPNWNSRLQPKESFDYIEISGVDNNAATIVKTRQVNGQNAPSRAKRLVYFGDVIFATTRPYLKNIAIVPDNLDDQICSTGFCVLRPNLDLVNSKWLYYVARSDYVMNQIIVGQEKNAYPSVTNDEVLSAEMPVPPVKTQERYVCCLEQSRAKAESLKQLQAETEAELESFLPALLAKAFRGEL